MSLFKQDIRCYMEYGDVGSERRIEITGVNITYSLRELPTATIQVGTGYDTADGTYQPNFATPPIADVPAKIYVVLQGPRGESLERWGQNPILLFRGFVNAIAATRLAGQSAGNLSLRHWSSSLDSANLLSSIAKPGDSAEIFLPAYRRIKQDAGAKRAGGLTGLIDEKIVYVDPGQVEQNDIWADIVKPFLIRVSKQNEFEALSGGKTCFDGEGGDNLMALAALADIEGVTDDEYSKPLHTKYGKPVLLPQAAPAAISSSIRSYLTRPTTRDLSRETAWSYIIRQVCSPFMLAFVPGIDTARVVPLVPTLAETYATLEKDQIVVHDASRPITHPLLATVMSAGRLNSAGAARAQKVGEPAAFGPCYSPANATKDGLVDQVEPPPWLRTAQFSAFDPATTLRLTDGVANGLFSTNTAAADADANAKAVELRAALDLYGQEYVKAAYGMKSVMGHRLKLYSYLRGDIGPGSQVRVNSEDGLVGFGNTVYGMVSRITLVINAGQPMAATMFDITNVRNPDEFQTDYLGLTRHPLFEDTYVGGSLSDEFE